MVIDGEGIGERGEKVVRISGLGGEEGVVCIFR